jgi:undecaprenyl-diphosphatase
MQLIDALQTDEMIGNVWLLVVGTLVAAVVGTLTVRWLLGFVERHSLGLFAVYRVVVGVVVLVVLTWTGT